MTKLPILIVEPDPYLAVQVEGLLADVEPRPELIAVADVEELMRFARPGCVVLAGPSQRTSEAVGELQMFHDAFPSARLLLAWDRKPGAAVREVIKVGAEWLVDPRDDEALREALLVSLDRAERSAPAPTLVHEETDEDAPAAMGKVFTVCSATGGCGKTFYASNLAFLLSKYSRGRVALVDLDLQFGEVVTALRVRFRHTIIDAIAITSDEELNAYVPELLVAHESGVWVLPAPADPAEADQVRPSDVTRVIKALQAHFDYIVIDNPTGLGDSTLAAMDLSEHLFVLAALDLSSVRNLRLFLQTTERLQVDDAHMSLILNKDQSGVGIDAAQVEKLFPRGFRSIVPFSKDVPKSMNQGIPVLAGEVSDELARALTEGLVEFLPVNARSDAYADLDAMGGTGLLKKLFGRGGTGGRRKAAVPEQADLNDQLDTEPTEQHPAIRVGKGEQA